jgi:antitoxin ParD1/3/4
MGTNVHLTPELERFARDCVADGRYNNVSEVVRDALRLLQDAAERKRQFMAMLHEVQAEVDRDGTVSIEEALVEFDRIVDEAEQARKAKA